MNTINTITKMLRGTRPEERLPDENHRTIGVVNGFDATPAMTEEEAWLWMSLAEFFPGEIETTTVAWIPFVHRGLGTAGMFVYPISEKSSPRHGTYLYFNPSSGDDDGAYAFVYEGPNGNPAFDASLTFYTPQFEDIDAWLKR